MNQVKLKKFINSCSKPILADGAMGTLLHSHGVGFDECFDELNLTKKDLIAEIHQSYIQAGSQIIFTNTFGANKFKLAKHGLDNLVSEINKAGVEIAKRAVAESGKDILIAGDVGPLGIRLVPYGRVKTNEAKKAFLEQIHALCDAGADLLVIETFGDLDEICAAVSAARETCQHPVIASVTFTRDDQTIMGDTPSQVAVTLKNTGADLIGANCSGGPAQLYRIIRKMKQAVPDARLIVKPNAGWPEQVGGRVMYSADPKYFREYAKAYSRLGVCMIGGCCGTTPNHIAEMSLGIESKPEAEINIRPIPSLSKIKDSPLTHEQPTILAQKLSKNEFVVSVEMDPPRGLTPHKIIAGASMLKEAGASVINVADSPMARMRMSPWAVCELIQKDADIETTLHFPTRGRNLLRVQGDLLAAHALGIRNVFVVMGDPTSIGDYPNAMDTFDLVPSGLIKLIKQRFNQGVDHAGSGIGQPTDFFVGCALNLIPADPEREIKILHRKIINGADFALTQPIYDPTKVVDFLKQYADRFGKIDIPILVGVLPLFSTRHAAFLHNEVPGIHIPDHIRARMIKAGNNGQKEGVKISTELIDEIKKWGQGVYIMPAFDRYDIAAEIIDSVSN